MEKRYDKISESADMACEPLGDYGSAAQPIDSPEEMGYLPSDYVNKAALIALAEKREGRLIPAERLLDCIYADLGWK